MLFYKLLYVIGFTISVFSGFIGQRLSEGDPMRRPANPLLFEFVTNAASWAAVVAAIAAFWLIDLIGLLAVVFAFVAISNIAVRMKGFSKPSTAICTGLLGVILLILSSSRLL